MTLREFEELVSTVRFRRGWRLAVRSDDQGNRILTVYADVENARAPGQIRIQADRILMGQDIADMTEEQAILYIWYFLLESDEHEAAEWFTVRGVRVREPHRELR